MARPALPAIALLLMIPATSHAEAPAEADSPVADPADPVESSAPEASEIRVAYAGPPGTAVVEPTPPPPPAPEIPTGLAANRDADAASGRAFLTPTANTGKKGSVRVDTWFPTLPIVGYATVSYSITNKLEVGVGGAWVADEGDGAAVSLRVKWSPLRGKRGGVAVELQRLAIPDEGDGVTLLSAVGSHCLDADCRTVGSLSITAIPEESVPVDDGYGSSSALHFVGGASLVTGGKLKLVLDALTIEDGDDRAFGGYAGVRLARPRWALDAGFVAGGDGNDSGILPVPLVGASARW